MSVSIPRNTNLEYILKQVWRKKQQFFYSLLLLAFNLFLLSLPLTNSLGYEFSAANGIVLFFLGGALLLSFLKTRNTLVISLFFKERKYLFISSLVIPFLVGFIFSLIISKCPILPGILFYLLIPLPSFFFGISTAYISYFLSKKYAPIIFILFSLLIVLSAVSEIYFYPQVYFYNILIGYFPGTIYDEDVAPGIMLAFYRLLNFVFFTAITYYSLKLINRKPLIKISYAGGILVILIIFSFLKPLLNLATDLDRLNKSLPKTVVSNSFDIHFNEKHTSDELEYSALIHEYYLDQLNIYLENNNREKIDSYIFENREQKRTLFGSGNADVAKPWLRQIYLNETNYESTVKHELAHIILSKYGTPPFKIAAGLNPALTEGVAMALENNYNGYPLHYMAKLAEISDYKADLTKIFSGLKFFSITSSTSYIKSGSFIKFLIENYGIKKAKKLYNTGSFEEVYGKKLSTLSQEYNEFLKNYQIDFNRNTAQLYFGTSTIFKKYCPRTAAVEMKKGNDLFEEKRWEEALEVFKKIYAYSKSPQSLNGMINCLLKEKRYSEGETLLGKELPSFKSSSYFFYFELMAGDLSALKDDMRRAGLYYDSLLVQNPEITYTNEVLIRKEFLKQGKDSLNNYLISDAKSKFGKLLSLNSSEIKYFTLPAMLSLTPDDRTFQKDILRMFAARIKVMDNESKYAAFKFSQFALKNSEYETARQLAILSLNFKNNFTSDEKYYENLRMINWFINNKKEISIRIN